jgi:nitronate monooxygenase
MVRVVERYGGWICAKYFLFSCLLHESESYLGDKNGDVRRALATFHDQDMVTRFMDKYFIENGKAQDKPYKSLPMWTIDPPQALLEACVLSNYAEVWLAKHNDDNSPVIINHNGDSGSDSGCGLVGVNRLTKVQLPTLASLYGAMLAQVDYVIMGAGIPLHVPGVLDAFAEGRDASFPIDVMGAQENMHIRFSPLEFWTKAGKPELAEELSKQQLQRPNFLPIVSSVVLAQSMLKKANGQGPAKGINGFVIELPTAGGHNAPPRGFRYDPVAKSHAVDLNERGEPIYGPKDQVDLHKFLDSAKGLPFWLAGSYGHADRFCEILEMGGAGVQVGTLFALCKESGMDEETKQQILSTLADPAEQGMDVFTDPVASPTGYPFKALQLPGTLSEEQVYQERPRLCSLGYLRTPYIDQKTGHVGYRCPAEPVEDWLKKGGEIEATVGRKCLCNALCANVGLPQTRKYKTESGETKTYVEDKFITIGDDINFARQFLKQDSDGKWSIAASDIVDYLKSQWSESEARQELKEAVFKDVKTSTTSIMAE